MNRVMEDNTTEDTKKWVRNLSNTPLTEDQEKLLAWGPKFSIRPRQPPMGEYVVAVEQACSRLNKGEAEEMRVEVKKALKKAQCSPRPPSNISKKEYQTLSELKEDKSRVILTADKRVSLVIMDKAEYHKKAEELLNTRTYKKISEDPTKKQKNKLISILKNIKTEGGLNEETFKRLYPTAAVPSKFYGLPKIHKPGIPLRPIVSSIGAATYNTAKELAKILKPLVGMSAHHVQNTRDCVEQIKDVRLKQGECIISYDVTALFTSMPIQPVLNIIKQSLSNDHDLHKRTTMSTSHVINLLEFCLGSTSFVYQRQFYQQLEGAAMGSPLSPIVANIFMEQFEEEALATAPHPPSLWNRYVDDTFVIQEEQYKNEFFQHINSLDDNIQFTAETTKADGSMPFLDTLVTPKSDGSLETKVYRKPTHTNQYLQYDSHHAITNKYSIISTLLHRAKHICSNQHLLKEEQTNIKKALTACKYPNWAISRMKLKIDAPKARQNNKNNRNT